jgi:hypothetical protein
LSTASRGRELVREIIRAVEEDRELRYMLLGALGLHELLERFARLEERQQKLEERFARLEERFAELEARFARLEEEFKKLEERQQRLEEEFRKLYERQLRLEERFAELEKRFAQLEERVARLEEEMRETRRVVLVVAHRFGVIAEEAFREAMRFVVEEVFGVGRVEKWVYRDEEGFVYGYPSIVEVDVLIRDGEHVLLEVKSRVSKADVAEAYRIGRLYGKVVGRKPRVALLGGFIDAEARRLARRLGVEVIPISSDIAG